jgi:membrane protein YdbS with pleckstrin-like domain
MELHPLAPRARLLFHLQALSRLFFAWLPMIGGLAFGLGALWQVFGALVIAGALAVLALVVSVWMPSLAFDRWGYLLRDEDLLIARGVLVRRVTTIPTHRIQHVDTQQGPLEQWLGLARVQVHTASGLGADGVIPGLWHDDAEALRDALVQRSQSAADDGV